MILIGIVITSVLYWATTNVCRYNFMIEKKTNQMNIIAAEIKPEIKLGEVYYFKELNCNNVDISWDYERVISNLNTISVMIYQELTTDIKGNPILKIPDQYMTKIYFSYKHNKLVVPIKKGGWHYFSLTFDDK